MAHYYTKDGQAAHFQPTKAGGSRPTTIRDARKLSLVPSVTEIINIAAKPALTKWLVDQAFLAALTLPRIDGESVDEFKKRAEKDSREQSQKAMDLGTEIHKDLERIWTGLTPLVHKDIAQAVKEKIVAYTGLKEGWETEKTFASPLGYGGMVDLFHPHDKTGWVVDFKTKAFDDPEKKLAWDEHGMQLSAYAHGLGMLNARKLNVFISTTVPDLIVIYEWEEDLFPRFECLLRYWQLAKDYRG